MKSIAGIFQFLRQNSVDPNYLLTLNETHLINSDEKESAYYK